MKATRILVCTGLLVLFGYYGAFAAPHKDPKPKAEDPAENNPGSESPDPDPETPLLSRKPKKDIANSNSGVDVLFKLAGRWKLEEEYPKGSGDDEAPKGKGDANYKKSLDNTFLIGDYKSKCKDLSFNVKGHAIFTYDEDEETYRYWWFDNYGASMEFEGEYKSSGNTLIFTRESEGQDGETFIDKHTFKFNQDGTVKFTIDSGKSDKKPSRMITTTYSKKGSKKNGDQPREDRPPKIKRSNRM